MADTKISALTGATTPLAGTEVLPIVQSGATKKVAVNDLTAGKYTPSNGIQFPAVQVPSANVNILDDYEEGTWTPIYTAESGSFTTMTMSVENAVYTKIGRLVIASAYVATDNVDATGASGGVRISGLPFTSNIRTAAALARVAGFAGDFPLSGYVDFNSDFVQLFYRTSVNGGETKVDVSDMTTGASGNKNVVVFSAAYVVAT